MFEYVVILHGVAKRLEVGARLEVGCAYDYFVCFAVVCLAKFAVCPSLGDV